MGITGLLPLLKPVTKDIHVSSLKGLTVGIDTYCWLHRGIYSCSTELCQGIPTDKFIKYCVERVHLLLSHGIRPYLIFDGGLLPAKAGKEEERRARREANMQRGKQLLREGNASAAQQYFSKAADVTPFMANQLIQVIKRIPGVKYVVAPYEADAQLGFLARNGHVDAVITEDSDIILFGCTRVVFKLDRDGTGQEVDLREVFSRRNDELDMRGMDEDHLMTLCALSGCDYLPSVYGMGLKKAHRLVSRHKELPKILRAVKFESAGGFPQGYEADFHRALLTFRHQRAFDPVLRKVVHMTPLPDVLPNIVRSPPNSGSGAPGELSEGNALDFLGPAVTEERGCAVADGDMDPITGESFIDAIVARGKEGQKAPETVLSDSAATALAAWRGGSNKKNGGGVRSSKKKLSCAQDNNLTKYWGAPLSSPKESALVSAEVKEGDARRIDRLTGYEFSATPQRAPRGAAMRFDGGAGGSGGESTAEGGDDNAASRMLEAGRGEFQTCSAGAKKDSLPGADTPPSLASCVSPSSFYAGTNSSPTPPHLNASGDNKENHDPMVIDHDTRLKEMSSDDGDHQDLPTAPTATSKSKHFGSSHDDGLREQASGKAFRRRGAAGLRKRFRPPLSTAAGPNASGPAQRAVGTESNGRQASSGQRSWETDFTYQSHPADQRGSGGEDRSKERISAGGSNSSGGSRLKRRRTLGLGSLAPMGLLRSLDGNSMVARGSGKLARGGEDVCRRSKSLGGIPAVVSAVPDADGSEGNHDDTENACVSNLFERFAARCPQKPLQITLTEKLNVSVTNERVVSSEKSVAGKRGGEEGKMPIKCPDTTSAHKQGSDVNNMPAGGSGEGFASVDSNVEGRGGHEDARAGDNEQRRGRIGSGGRGPLSERPVNSAIVATAEPRKYRKDGARPPAASPLDGATDVEGKSDFIESAGWSRGRSDDHPGVVDRAEGGRDIFARFVYTA